MKKHINKLIIIAILLLAFALRFYKLNSYPALNADEAAIGYNAYSLIQTGKDEHGNSWPIQFQSFNDYKPGLYVYLVMPFIKVLGLNEWAVRIPGAFLGVVTVYVVYLLIKELFPKEKFAYIASLLLAISPWHIHFSRGGWEVNVATFLISLGIYLFIKAFKFPKNYFFSIISFCLSLYTYH
ncbi:glycosyltransferase family 39 protein, partial [Patescibacteria group bacterium]|nr:glycosyltransferase family 39 protein [Patescibacteria group bacterium]